MSRAARSPRSADHDELTERLTHLAESAKQHLDGDDRGLDVLESILMRQAVDGQWDDPHTPEWNVVRTAIVLKALAKLGFTAESSWRTPAGIGCVRTGLDFLSNEFLRSQHLIGEDVWDTCQAFLALKAFSLPSQGWVSDRARRVLADWSAHWSVSRNEAWGGTAVLAALIDLSLAFDPEDHWQYRGPLLQALLAEHRDRHFSSFDPHKSHSCWHTALVIRTLAQLLRHGVVVEDSGRILADSVQWLLDARGRDNAWRVHAKIHYPMYTARSIEALSVVQDLLEPSLKEACQAAVQSALRWLAQIWNSQTRLIGDLKSTTSILEMYASIVMPVPALSILQCARHSVKAAERSADVAVVCALRSPELEELLLACSSSLAAAPAFDVPPGYHAFVMRNAAGRDLRIVAKAPHNMGLAPTATLTTEMIHLFAPRLVVMSGIAAGVDPKTQSIGDVLVAKRAYNYRSGKIFEGGKFKPDFRQIEIDKRIIDAAQEMANDRRLLSGIESEWGQRTQSRSEDRPTSYIRVHLGPVGSADQVIDSREVVPEAQEHERKLMGLEMETYGLYVAAVDAEVEERPFFLSCKSICDFATEKHDGKQVYAAFTSARFVASFIRQYSEMLIS